MVIETHLYRVKLYRSQSKDKLKNVCLHIFVVPSVGNMTFALITFQMVYFIRRDRVE